MRQPAWIAIYDRRNADRALIPASRTTSVVRTRYRLRCPQTAAGTSRTTPRTSRRPLHPCRRAERRSRTQFYGVPSRLNSPSPDARNPAGVSGRKPEARLSGSALRATVLPHLVQSRGESLDRIHRAVNGQAHPATRSSISPWGSNGSPNSTNSPSISPSKRRASLVVGRCSLPSPIE